jgi:hypothetical protein
VQLDELVDVQNRLGELEDGVDESDNLFARERQDVLRDEQDLQRGAESKQRQLAVQLAAFT